MKDTKLDKLVKYEQLLANKLASPLPLKHKNNEATYRQFLKREQETNQNKIAKLKHGSN